MIGIRPLSRWPPGTTRIGDEHQTGHARCLRASWYVRPPQRSPLRGGCFLPPPPPLAPLCSLALSVVGVAPGTPPAAPFVRGPPRAPCRASARCGPAAPGVYGPMAAAAAAVKTQAKLLLLLAAALAHPERLLGRRQRHSLPELSAAPLIAPPMPSLPGGLASLCADDRRSPRRSRCSDQGPKTRCSAPEQAQRGTSEALEEFRCGTGGEALLS